MNTLNKGRIFLIAAATLAATSAVAQLEQPPIGDYGRIEDQRVIRETVINGRVTRAEAPWMPRELQQEFESELIN